MPAKYRESPLAEILPIRVEPKALSERPPDLQDRSPARLSITGTGRQSAAIQLAGTSGGTELLWNSLPGVNWVFEGAFPAPHASVLAVGGGSQTPVAITGYAGLGKVVFLGSDSFWRWRTKSGRKYHRRLWNQIFLWATMEQAAGVDNYVNVVTDHPAYLPGETVALKARVLGIDRMPLRDATVSATVTDEDGNARKRILFQYLPQSGGQYRAQVEDLPRGTYTVVPHVVELGGTQAGANYSFEVREMATTEYVDLSLNQASLAALSEKNYHFVHADKIPEQIPRIRLERRQRQDVELWDTGAMMAAVALLLGLEWRLRKKCGLV
jgi:hypothetical protein